jgi:aldose 1-epimerase
VADDTLIELSAGELHAGIAPAVGGSIARFGAGWQRGAAQGRVDWLRPASADGLAARNPLAMASFPLLPFCNRIRNGSARFEGREIRFPPNHPAQDSPHPLHGIGWLKPWSVVQAGTTRATLALEVPASEAWPWRFSARQEVTLTPQALEVAMTLTNEDTAAMPAGIGHHPYFPHTPGTRLTSPVAGMWRGDEEVMPTALETGGAVVDKLSSGVVLSELDLDNNFTGWGHTARVDWPADAHGPARSLTLRADPPLDYFVVYCPAGYDHFCAEPVSQCTDWLNLLPTYGQGPLGGTRLASGQSLRARFTLTPRWA